MATTTQSYEIPELDHAEFDFEVTYEVIQSQADVGLPNGDIEIQSAVCDNNLVEKLIQNNDINYDAISQYFTDILIEEIV